jgi:uncharacterized membrane protein YccC
VDKAQLLRPLTTIDQARPDYVAGIRGVASSAPPLFLGIATNRLTEGMIASVIAQLVASTDNGGAFWRRLAQTLGITVIGSGLVCLGSLASGHVARAVVLMAVSAFVGGIVSMYGMDGVAFNVLIPIPPLMMLGSSVQSGQLIAYTLAALAGGIWAALMSIAPWPFQRNKPALDSLAEAYDSIALFTDTLLSANDLGLLAPKFQQARVDVWAKLVRANRDGHHVKLGDSRMSGAQYAGLGHDLGMAVVALRHAQRDGPDSWPPLGTDSRRFFDALANYCHLTAISLRRGEVVAAPAQLLADLRAIQLRDPALSLEVGELARILGELDGKTNPKIPTTPFRWWQLLRWRLSWPSPVLRHAFRFSVSVALATLISEVSGMPHGYWIILTVVVLVRPEIRTTINRITQRMVGTAVGMLVGALLILALSGSVMALAILANAFLFLMFTYGKLNYVYYVLALTPSVLLTLAIPDPGDWEVAGWRFLSTVIGSVLAVLAVYLLWPTRGRHIVPMELARSLLAIDDLLAAIATHPASRIRRSHNRALVSEARARQMLNDMASEPGEQTRHIQTYRAILIQSNTIRTLSIRISILAACNPENQLSITDLANVNIALRMAASSLARAGGYRRHIESEPHQVILGADHEASAASIELLSEIESRASLISDLTATNTDPARD